MFKVGDKVLHIADTPDFGKILTVRFIDKNGIVFAAEENSPLEWCGKYHQTGAGYLGKPTDKPMIRKLTKLDKALK